jgi:NADH:ubiquinone oxidoreductase subunit F (NADH-binding)
LYRVQEVVSFFPHFRTEPPAKVEVAVCREMSCRLRGAAEIVAKLNGKGGQNELVVREVGCLGRCDRAPAALVNEHDLYVARSAEEFERIIGGYLQGESPTPDKDRDCSTGNRTSWQVDPYNDESERYGAVRAYLEDPSPHRVIDALKTAGLLGMGGAGGRAYKKWDDVLQAQGAEKFVVCNADESEPGTFKDRELLLHAPHVLLEGMILAGLVCGASRGYVYIRHEYDEAIKSVEAEIERAQVASACGDNIYRSGESFHLEVFISPGGYICGEQTALIEAMEDKRAQPRNRPPQLQTNGLRDKPTLLNNVETFAWVPTAVLKDNGNWFKQAGAKEQFSGRRFFSISGDVNRPGAYEVPNGVTVRELVEDYAGGVRDDRTLKAIALSGPSGGLTPAKIPVKHVGRRFLEAIEHSGDEFDLLDLPLDIGVSRASRVMVGAGIVVYDDSRDLVDQAWACSRFFHDESCGKCVPCRIGSHKIVEMMQGIKNREDVSVSDLAALVEQLAGTMEVTSICGLGMVAANPMKTLLRFFGSEVEQHLHAKGQEP